MGWIVTTSESLLDVNTLQSLSIVGYDPEFGFLLFQDFAIDPTKVKLSNAEKVLLHVLCGNF